MLTIEYEQSLVETAVFLAVRTDARLEGELHKITDRLYEIPDEEQRQREFVPVFRDSFTKLGLDRLISGLLAERPLIGEQVERCVVREAAKRRAECAELHVRSDASGDDDGGRTLVIQICPQSFIETGRFITLMRRELLHVADMLDERFGYVREAFSGEPSRQNLQRDRYRILWDTFVEGRLDREQLSTKRDKDRYKHAFGRAFGLDPDSEYDAAVERVFDADSLTHNQLMDWAREPAQLFDASPAANMACASRE